MGAHTEEGSVSQSDRNTMVRSQLSLSMPLIKRIVAALPVAEGGRVVVDLGILGVGSLRVDQLSIGSDIMQLPVNFHLRGDPDSKGMQVTLALTHWYVSDEVIWFKLEQLGRLKGALSQKIVDALFTLIDGIRRRSNKDPSPLLRRNGQLGIPVAALLAAWLDRPAPLQIEGITLDHGITLHLS